MNVPVLKDLIITLREVEAFLDIASDHPDYHRALCDQMLPLMIAPAHHSRMVFLHCRTGHVAFTWCYVLRPLDDIPTATDWSRDEGVVWIVDAVGSKGLSGVSIGKAIRKALVNRGIAKDGQIAYFWRNHSARYGAFVARG